MRHYTSIAVIAVAAFGLFAGPARADNDGITETNAGNIAIPGIHVNLAPNSVDRAELAPAVRTELDGLRTDVDTANTTNTAQGITLTDHGGRIVTLEGTAVAHDGRITALETNDGIQDIAIASHTATLADHETRVTNTETVNGTQQTQIDNNTAVNNSQQTTINGHTTTLATHTTQIAGVQAKNVEQDGRLDGHDTAIGSLETITASHTSTLNAHSALLSEHSATLKDHGNRLDEHEKGLAIAMALPDAWLGDSKQFGVFGSVGGFNNETAVGFAAIGRIDQTFSLNAKFGADTEGKQFGWQAGVGAQW
jgi:hypothetical protein